MPQCLITDERLSREKSGIKRRVLRDTRITGFQVVISPQHKSFVVRTGRVYRTIGHWPLWSATEARLQALELLRRYTSSPGDIPITARVKVPTLGEAFETYLKAKRLRPKSVETYRAIMKSCAPDLLAWPMSSITTAVYTDKFRAKAAKSQANLHARLVAAIYVHVTLQRGERSRLADHAAEVL